MKRTLLLSIILVCATAAMWSQSRYSLIKELEQRRGTILNQIKESESLLNSTSKDVASQLNNLSALSGQIEDRKRYIMHMNNDLKALNREMNLLESDLVKLETQLSDRKGKYEASLKFMRRNKNIEDKLLFIFSAKSLRQTYRRIRYVNEYADYQRLQAQEIMQKQQQIKEKKEELNQTKKGKERLLLEREEEQKRLEQQEKRLKELVESLQNKQKQIRNEIAKKRKEAEQLNNRIDDLVAEEIERARKEGEAEARKESAGTTPSTTTPTPMGSFKMSKADTQLSGSFLSNRGKLPVPVTGSYAIVSRFGQYSVEGLRFVKLENKGIDIQTTPGSEARAVFDGEVSAVFQFQGNGLFNVLVRHGNYITVYCNLATTMVKKGDKVKINQPLGIIYSDPADNSRTVLHFQLRREREQLNPELWLER